MYIGVFAMMPSTISEVTPSVLARVRRAGFSGVGFRIGDPLEVSLQEVEKLRSLMDEAGVDLAQLSAPNPDLVHQDNGERRAGVRVMQRMCTVARVARAHTLYVRPGSLNSNGPWYPHPENRHERVVERLVASLRAVASAAEQEGVVLALEGHVLSPLYSAEQVKAVLDAVSSPSLRFNSDPVNFIGGLTDAYDSVGVVNHLFDLLGRYTVSAHIKDYYVENRLVLHVAETVLGDGLLDQVTFLRRMQTACPQGYLLIEHLADEDVARAKAALDAAAKQAGVNFDTNPRGG